MIKQMFAPISGILVFALQLTAQADIIKCHFTEPFVTTVYSMSQQTLTVTSFDEPSDKVQVVKNISFQIKAAGKFELVDKDGNTLQKLDLNGNGSDGMSDTVFPYEVTDTSMDKFANNGVGGCSSNYLKATPQ